MNNAGSYHEAGSILDQSVESWRRSIDVNLAGLFNCSKPVAERMVAQGGGGAIVNIASVDGLLPCLGTGYDSSKAGAIHFSRSLAVDLAPHGIRVNAVSPGVVPVPTLDRMHAGEIEHFWPKQPVDERPHGADHDAAVGQRAARPEGHARPTSRGRCCSSSARRRAT